MRSARAREGLERPGHVANRLQAAVWREAIHLVKEGVASVEDVDKAMWAGPGLRWAAMGPNMLFHLGAGAGVTLDWKRSNSWCGDPLHSMRSIIIFHRCPYRLSATTFRTGAAILNEGK